MLPIPDTQHNHKWATALVKTKPQTYGYLDELKTFSPMYGLGLEGPIVQVMFETLFKVSNRNRKAVRQALQCALLTLAQCAVNTSSTVMYGFVHRRGTDRTQVFQRYKDRGFSDEHLKKVLDELAECKYVRCEKGFKGEDVPKGLASLWLVEPSFSDWLEEHRESLHVVHFVEQRETVVLKSDAEGVKFKDYEDDEQTVVMRERIFVGNALRTRHQWTYMPLDSELCEDGELRRGKLKKEYRQFKLDDEHALIPPASLECRRVFKGDFESGGRFYCGAQSLNKAERATIQIDGEPTVELDLKSLHPRMLYHLEGLEAPHDCYVADTKEQRVRNKMICMYLINNKDRKTALRAFMADFGGTSGEAAAEFQEFIDQHSAIDQYFFKSGWKRLQFMDSQIVDKVLAAAIEKEVPLLPVHDSFIIKTRNAFWLNEMIVACYRELMGFEPVVDW